jgi:hypothetical protein
MTPAFAAAKVAADLAACRTAAEDIVMMTPECLAPVPGRNAEIFRKVEVRLLSMAHRQWAAVSSVEGRGVP